MTPLQVFIDHPLLADYCTDSLFLTTLPLVVNPLSGEHVNVTTASHPALNASYSDDTEFIDA